MIINPEFYVSKLTEGYSQATGQSTVILSIDLLHRVVLLSLPYYCNRQRRVAVSDYSPVMRLTPLFVMLLQLHAMFVSERIVETASSSKGDVWVSARGVRRLFTYQLAPWGYLQWGMCRRNGTSI